MESPDELRSKAEHYRQLGSNFLDQRTIDALSELADEYEAVADRLEKKLYGAARE